MQSKCFLLDNKTVKFNLRGSLTDGFGPAAEQRLPGVLSVLKRDCDIQPIISLTEQEVTGRKHLYDATGELTSHDGASFVKSTWSTSTKTMKGRWVVGIICFQ